MSGGGAPPGVLPSRFGASGYTPFQGGRGSIKRSFQALSGTAWAHPFDTSGVPSGIGQGPTPGFAVQSLMPSAADKSDALEVKRNGNTGVRTRGSNEEAAALFGR